MKEDAEANARSYITALFDDAQSACEAVPALKEHGVQCDEICAAALPPDALTSMCDRFSVVPMEPPIAEQLTEVGVSVQRATHCEERVKSGGVLLLLPALLHSDECLQLLRDAGADARTEPGEETIRVSLHAEQVHVQKRTVRDSDVRVRKIVALVTERIDVPLKREELIVTRTPANGEAETIRIPLSHEEVEIHKRIVVANEATVRRESTEFVQHITEPVRRERLEVRQVDSSPEPHSTAFAATNAGNSSPLTDQATRENVNTMHDTGSDISAFFPARMSAEAAADELRSQGIPDDNIVVQEPGGSGFLDGVKRFFSGEQLDAPEEGGAILVVRDAQQDLVAPIIESNGGRMENAGMNGAYRDETDEIDDDADGGTMQLHEERLNVTKHPEKQGEVRLKKEVVTTQQDVDVPVKREEVVLTRHRIDEPDDSAEIGEGEEIRIPVLRDEVSVEKERITTEEVGVEKRDVESTQHVSASLQKERARLETDGQVGTTLDDRD